MAARTTLPGRGLAVSLTLGVTLAVAGCGNQDTRPGYASSDSGSGGVAYADKALTKDEIMRVTYDAAQKAGTSHLTMHITGKARLAAKGDVAYGAGQPRMNMTMTMPQLGHRQISMRYVGKVLYMQIPGLTPAGKFVAIDPSDKRSPLGRSFAGTTDQMDPMKSIKALESAVRSAERVGKQSLGGVTVEHYQLTVDTSALVKDLGPAAATQAHLPKTITYDLWLDQQHLLRRTSFEMSGVHFEATMSRWGRPVQVHAPSAGQIVRMPQA